MIGSADPRSTSTNAIDVTTVAAIRARMVGEPQANSLPPQEATSTSAVVAAASSTMPPMSSLGFTLLPLGRCRRKIAASRARAPRGTLIQKVQRQPMPSVNQPPSSGPATEETAKTPPMMPMFLPRSRAGTTSAMIAWERIMSPPPPSPWMTRPTISQFMSPARAPTTEPATKSRIAAIRRPLRPIRSPSLP